MTETNQNFEITQGDTKVVTINVTDESGNPKDLTGSTRRWGAFDKSDVAVVSKANADISLVQVFGTGGVFDGLRFTLAPADTSGVASATYRHEAETVDSGSNVATVTKGAMMVLKQLLV